MSPLSGTPPPPAALRTGGAASSSSVQLPDTGGSLEIPPCAGRPPGHRCNERWKLENITTFLRISSAGLPMSPALLPAWARCRGAHRPPYPSTASSPPPVGGRITIPTRCPVIITAIGRLLAPALAGELTSSGSVSPIGCWRHTVTGKKRPQDPRELRRPSWHRRRQTDPDPVMRKTGASQHRHARVPPEAVAGTRHLLRPALPELHHQIGRGVRIGPARGTGLNLR